MRSTFNERWTCSSSVRKSLTPATRHPASQSAAPVIKDPAEYNAYVAAIQQKDPTAKISGLEAFLTQYPNSVMKEDALETLMGAYQAKGDRTKAQEYGKKAAEFNSLPQLNYAFIRAKAQRVATGEKG